MEGSLPCGILSQSGGDGVAQDALIHLRRVDLRPDHGFPHHERSELRGGKIRQGTLKFSYGRTDRGDNDYVFHRQATSIFDYGTSAALPVAPSP
jgi:hypothetical protein